jgi:hemoglobin-like flavoprotein
MTEEQIRLVKKTWMIFQKVDPVLVGEVFYEKLFTDHPSFQRMFITPRQAQSKKIIVMLNLIVSRLDTLGYLKEELKDLAVRHVNYGVKPEYYRPVGIALLWMLQQGLGCDWNEEVGEAWDACYRTISGIMIEESKVK